VNDTSVPAREPVFERAQKQPLYERGIYCLGLTPYQYTVRATGRGEVPCLLMPEWPDNARIGGPVMYVLPDGRLGRTEGITGLTVGVLHFTGRYKDG
jgi:hypothetical protein